MVGRVLWMAQLTGGCCSCRCARCARSPAGAQGPKLQRKCDRVRHPRRRTEQPEGAGPAITPEQFDRVALDAVAVGPLVCICGIGVLAAQRGVGFALAQRWAEDEAHHRALPPSAELQRRLAL
eukprot:7357633-Prymnesium_polylepis.1